MRAACTCCMTDTTQIILDLIDAEGAAYAAVWAKVRGIDFSSLMLEHEDERRYAELEREHETACSYAQEIGDRYDL